MSRLFLAILLAFAPFSADRHRAGSDPDNLVVHEWGTFTSIAGEDGQAIEWQPLDGQNDLPCFVARFKHFRTKASIRGTIRMETPVLYFYAPRETMVDVSVRFPRGLVTEFFPHADVTPAVPVADNSLTQPGFTSTATWARVKVVPGGREAFPSDARASHYYAARRTDASPIAVGTQTEKFLFYRGVGHAPLPVTATVEPNGRIRVKSTAGALGTVMLFEKRGTALGYSLRRASGSRLDLDPPALTGSLEAIGRDLERILTAEGLYPKEARAMVETWRDSWFEEGTRLLYILPRPTVDAMLPLAIAPRPAEIARVFVGRMEVVTAATRNDVQRALETRDRAALQRYGRFLLPLAERLLADPSTRLPRRDTLDLIYSSFAAAMRATAPAGCR